MEPMGDMGPSRCPSFLKAHGVQRILHNVLLIGGSQILTCIGAYLTAYLLKEHCWAPVW